MDRGISRIICFHRGGVIIMLFGQREARAFSAVQNLDLDTHGIILRGAWEQLAAAHFLSDMNVPYHVVGMPAGGAEAIWVGGIPGRTAHRGRSEEDIRQKAESIRQYHLNAEEGASNEGKVAHEAEKVSKDLCEAAKAIQNAQSRIKRTTRERRLPICEVDRRAVWGQR